MSSLRAHLEQEHKISPLSTYLKEIVYGGTDGIVTTFAIVAGFAGAATNPFLSANLPIVIVLLFGMANLFADGVSMAIGNFLSVRSNQDVYKAEKNKELHEIRTNPQIEKKETVEILQMKGFSSKEARALTEIYSHNEAYWLGFMMSQELEMPNPEGEKPLITSLTTLFSFVSFGFIPLVPYLLHLNQLFSFQYSILLTFFALILLGLLRFKVTKESIYRSVLEVVSLGSISATIAYIVGTMFRLS